LDGIPTKFLRDAATIIAPTVAHIVNLSFEKGIVPTDIKMAKVIPLYKKGNRLDPGNYRPVSILSVVSKIIEKVVHKQIYDYVSKNRLIYDFQSGFRRSYSTDTCLLFLTDRIRKELDGGNLCGMVLLDLQKAFDTVNHSILLDKVVAMGFSDIVKAWLASYLAGREQKVEVGGMLSESKTVYNGVPQGSVLGPLLFLLYINDIQDVVECNMFLYADE
jgi:retron-type reverse transcriptase